MMGPASVPLTPEARARGNPGGVPVVLADGREWRLAPGGALPALDPIRDRLWEHAAESGGLDLARDGEDCGDAAVYLLRRNYDVDVDEAVRLVVGADARELVAAVWRALFGDPEAPVGYSAWQRAALRLAGLDPGNIPPGEAGLVLELLVRAGRVPPASAAVTASREAARAAEGAAQMAAFRALAARQAARKAGAAGPVPAGPPRQGGGPLPEQGGGCGQG